MPLSCRSCGAGEVELLARVDSGAGRLLTSDGQCIDRARAKRLLCLRCACVSVEFDPPDRLEPFYRKQYDPERRFDDHPVVVSGRLRNRSSLLDERLLGGVRRAGTRIGSVLEIACGSGRQLRVLHDAFPGAELHGMDPSPEIGSELGEAASRRATLRRGFFDTGLYAGRRFDLVVAHGILNRTPTLPLLKAMAALCGGGALASLNLVLLDHSDFAPFVWDHSFTFTRSSFERYLAAAGFEVREDFDCSNNHHYLVRRVGPPSRAGEPEASPPEVAETRRLLATWTCNWTRALERFAAQSLPPRVALYGAGLHNGLLLGFAERPEVEYVIDDVKHGTRFWGRPVIDLDAASRIPDLHVVLCCRDRYANAMREKCRERDLPVTLLAHGS